MWWFRQPVWWKQPQCLTDVFYAPTRDSIHKSYYDNCSHSWWCDCDLIVKYTIATVAARLWGCVIVCIGTPLHNLLFLFLLPCTPPLLSSLPEMSKKAIHKSGGRLQSFFLKKGVAFSGEGNATRRSYETQWNVKINWSHNLEMQRRPPWKLLIYFNLLECKAHILSMKKIIWNTSDNYQRLSRRYALWQQVWELWSFSPWDPRMIF